MSVVIAERYEDGVRFAFDSQRTGDSMKTRGLIPGAAMNVVHMDNGITIGAVGNLAVKQVLTHHPEWFAGLGDGPLTKRYVVTEILPKLYPILKEKKQLNADMAELGASLAMGKFLLAKGRDLLYLDSDFSVMTVRNYAVIGKGFFWGLCPAFYAEDCTRISWKERAIRGLRAIQTHSNTVSSPYIFTDTRNRKFEFVTEGEAVCL